MLRRDAAPTQQSFADVARAMQAVPEGHVLLRMRRAVDWRAVDAELAEYYDAGLGRPSWPPALLLRMLVLEQFADLSDREIHE